MARAQGIGGTFFQAKQKVEVPLNFGKVRSSSCADWHTSVSTGIGRVTRKEALSRRTDPIFFSSSGKRRSSRVCMPIVQACAPFLCHGAVITEAERSLGIVCGWPFRFSTPSALRNAYRPRIVAVQLQAILELGAHCRSCPLPGCRSCVRQTVAQIGNQRKLQNSSARRIGLHLQDVVLTPHRSAAEKESKCVLVRVFYWLVWWHPLNFSIRRASGVAITVRFGYTQGGVHSSIFGPTFPMQSPVRSETECKPFKQGNENMSEPCYCNTTHVQANGISELK
ncbi:uncharacterized protein LOC129755059 [Uranotaenia lowii]|uniref:uncharacterized protein LOC129755059 n=1 Tax=Uranotaenia lowii TaxID=190385 RepID=UPI0024787C35|nr:uncharacterized protein LOC129755059 [Uranotaenia lowii]XP_055607365.1 uncharacterized protein LOC129755059 [Uranotaenia lowii]